ncbi:MAG: transcription elongation factor GreA [Anaerolineae bacterium SM23_ 63]|nr:MAG: transcription elongation factor GreA [Anaerolineae bacterium SM23_ 63]HEY47263.1 transcription elongation factor GreA [Anaerolineae bacterium]
MNNQKYYLTPEAAYNLRNELDELKGPRRSDLAKRLRFAIQQGDLTENADYIAAKEEQAFLEGRILELETLLRDAIIVENTEPCDQVRIGCTVKVIIGNREERIFHLVGMKEADPRQGKISHESPIGKALLDSRVGDTVTAETPAGRINLHILDIQ